MTRSLPLVILSSALLLPACGGGAKAPDTAQEAAAAETQASTTLDPALLGAFAPLPATLGVGGRAPSEPLVDLGRMLYYDTRLSVDQNISCNSCHDLARYGVDGKATSPGHDGRFGSRNSPSVYQAAGHVAQFWDGRAATVEEQAKGPVLNPIEMGMEDAAAVESLLRSIPGYREAFAKAFPDDPEPISFQHMADAIGAFERGLLTPGPFDAFLHGDRNALSPEQQAGLRTFVQTGCTACHNGAFVGGMLYQKLGLVAAWPELKDQGRGAVTGNPAENGFFKVPSLRNVARTGPWLHDGSVQDLSEMIRKMARYQLGKELDEREVASIRSFLESLTGRIPESYIARPELPSSASQ